MDYVHNEEVVAVGRWQTKEPKTLVNGLPLGPNAIKVYVDEVLNPDAYIWRPTVGKTAMEDYQNCFLAWPANSVMFDSETPSSTAGSSKSASPAFKNQKSPLSATATAKPATGVNVQSSAQGSPVTPPAPTKQPVIPASPLRRSEVVSVLALLDWLWLSFLNIGSALWYCGLWLQRNKFKPNQKIKLMDLSGNNVVVAEGRWSSNHPEHLVHFQPLGSGACRVFVDVVKVRDAAVWRTSSEIEYMEDSFGSCLAWPEDKVLMVRSRLFVTLVWRCVKLIRDMSLCAGLKEPKEPSNKTFVMTLFLLTLFSKDIIGFLFLCFRT